MCTIFMYVISKPKEPTASPGRLLGLRRHHRPPSGLCTEAAFSPLGLMFGGLGAYI